MSKTNLIRWPENTQEHAAFAGMFLRYDPETGDLYWKVNKGRVSAGSKAGSVINNRYIQLELAQRNMYAHRICWLLYYGYWPTGIIDHIDGNPSNNKIINLRDVSQQVNCQNSSKRKDNKSGCTGVSWCSDKERWVVRIMLPETKTYKFLGRFIDKEQAIAVRRNAQRILGYHENHGRLQNNR